LGVRVLRGAPQEWRTDGSLVIPTFTVTHDHVGVTEVAGRLTLPDFPIAQAGTLRRTAYPGGLCSVAEFLDIARSSVWELAQARPPDLDGETGAIDDARRVRKVRSCSSSVLVKQATE
jgi:hypothetical protein